MQQAGGIDSLYPLVSRLLRHAQGQTLAEFYPPNHRGQAFNANRILHSTIITYENNKIDTLIITYPICSLICNTV